MAKFNWLDQVRIIKGETEELDLIGFIIMVDDINQDSGSTTYSLYVPFKNEDLCWFGDDELELISHDSRCGATTSDVRTKSDAVIRSSRCRMSMRFMRCKRFVISDDC